MSKIQIELLTHAAVALISILRRMGYTCALCGDLACYGFGIKCVPKVRDLELHSNYSTTQQKLQALIFTPSNRGVWPSLETLKSQLVQHPDGQSRFFTSWDPHDNSNVLSYYDHTTKAKSEKTCVIDISFIDTAAIHLIRDVDGLPFVPISYVILQKLEEWALPLAKTSTTARRAVADVIQALLNLVYLLDDLDTEPLYPPLWDVSRERVQRFISEYSGSAPIWKKFELDLELLPAAKVVSPPPPTQPSEPPRILRSPEVFLEAEEPQLSPISNPTRTQMVIMAAKDSVRLLYKCGWRSAIFGGLACFLYGNTRAPNDVDLLVLLPPGSTVTAEELKQNLVVLDPDHFFTTPSKDPSAAYRILWYRLTNYPAQTAKTSCKVDLLLPGVMNLPNFPPSLIHWDEGLPLVPFSLLLLQKLQAWDDHRRSRDPIKWQRQRTDMEDLDGLTGLSAFDLLKLSRPWSDTILFSPEFQKMTVERVIDYYVKIKTIRKIMFSRDVFVAREITSDYAAQQDQMGRVFTDDRV
ncbi:hypothetical protein C0995_005278 [Termitomyces sp. Mi166|nr:hypothetical protein C0995_005278 [Termitomyces sp. Mi166\